MNSGQRMSLITKRQSRKTHKKEEKDIIGFLNDGFPHIIDLFLGDMVSYDTFLEIQKVPRWQASLLPSWKRQWERNNTQSPVWRMLSSRIQNLIPSLTSRLNCRNLYGYRDLCQCIDDDMQKIINNFKKGFRWHIQEAIIDFSKYGDTSRLSVEYTVPVSITYIGVSDKYIFVVFNNLGWKIKKFNRWTLTSTDYQYHLNLRTRKMYLNSRVVALHCGWKYFSSFIILDLETLKRIQVIGGEFDDQFSHRHIDSCCFLTEDFFYHTCMSHTGMCTGLFSTDIYQWNQSTLLFELVRKEEFKYKCDYFWCAKPKMYVDDIYLIYDWYEGDLADRFVRRIQVRCTKTWKLVHDRRFRYYSFIRREYEYGIIVILTKFNFKRCMIAWDVYKNTLKPIKDYPTDLYYSIQDYRASTTHLGFYQTLFDSRHSVHRCDKESSEKPDAGTRLLGRIQSLFTREIHAPITDHDSLAIHRLLYFDAVQAIGTISSETGEQLIVLDFIWHCSPSFHVHISSSSSSSSPSSYFFYISDWIWMCIISNEIHYFDAFNWILIWLNNQPGLVNDQSFS